VTFDHSVRFELDVALDHEEALAFVRDVRASLARARFLRDLTVGPPQGGGGVGIVTATLPVNAALFGQRDLPFRSRLHRTPDGARLEGLPIDAQGPGWAQVSGSVEVAPATLGSRLAYGFDIRVHVALPEPERWGGQALTKMIAYTASTVLARVTDAFPAAVAEAAADRHAERLATVGD
jgi:hypothetical protein